MGGWMCDCTECVSVQSGGATGTGGAGAGREVLVWWCWWYSLLTHPHPHTHHHHHHSLTYPPTVLTHQLTHSINHLLCVRARPSCTVIVTVGRRTHRRVHADELRSGTSARRGRYVSARGRCVQCFATAPVPSIGRKLKLVDGKTIPHVHYACDVCRVHLCRTCFTLYDHSRGGKPRESLTLR